MYCRGISYDRVLLNLLKVYSDAGNLILVINSSDHEENYYKSELDSKIVHESANTANERFDFFFIPTIILTSFSFQFQQRKGLSGRWNSLYNNSNLSC